MNPSQLAIATISWARDAEEAALLRASLSQLARLNLPVFITDGGSAPDFLTFLDAFPHFTRLQAQGKGVWAQARRSVQAAADSGARLILYTEPDKLTFFREHLPRFLAAAPADDQTGVVLAARTAAGFATFPAFQQMTETTINQCAAELIGQAVDYTYGPFLLHRDLAPYLSQVPEDIGWGWRPYTFVMAHRLGHRVHACEADFACPEDQRADTPTEKIYRMRQLHQNIQGLVLATTVNI